MRKSKLVVMAMCAAAIAGVLVLGGCAGQSAESVSSASAEASSSSESASIEMYVLKNSTMRSAPYENGDKVVKLAIGDKVKVVELLDTWAHVAMGEKDGYVELANLTDDPEKAAAAKEAAEKKAKEAAEKKKKEAAEKKAKEEAEKKAKEEAEAQAAAEAEAQAAAEAEAAAAAAEEIYYEPTYDDTSSDEQQDDSQESNDSGSSDEATDDEVVAVDDSDSDGEPVETSREYYPPCDGHEDGYTVIEYDDGTSEVVEGK